MEIETLDQIKEVWNSQADGYNQWDSLGEDEKIEFAQRRALFLSRPKKRTIQDSHLPPTHFTKEEAKAAVDSVLHQRGSRKIFLCH